MSPLPQPTLDAVTKRVWDVIVVGTGMGGATLGWQLAKSGRSVLFLEKGPRHHHEPRPPEQFVATRDDSPQARMARGQWPVPLSGSTDEGVIEFYAPLGCGTGGSSTLYAAQLERLRPIDFEPHRIRHAPGSNVPESWPVTYEEMDPYYARAEALYQVCGTEDPLLPTGSSLRKPPVPSERDTALMDHFRAKGLNPYRAHVGILYAQGCADCGGRFCPMACKRDSAWTCLLPALELDSALVTDCTVERIEADATSVSGVHFMVNGANHFVAGKVVALAAGAYTTPTLLLRSTGKRWPHGLANNSDQVGRNLMCHVSDFFAIGLGRRLSTAGPFKSIALNDFYVHEGVKLGTIHNVGVAVTTGHVFSFLEDQANRKPALWRSMLRPFHRLMAEVGARLYRNASLFAHALEDLPYADNRIVLDPSTANGSRFHYTHHAELRERVDLLRSLITDRIGKRHVTFFTRGIGLNYGHVCGTCRAGESAASSVLDRNNKSHDLDNLYVVDASFFPTSGGINPSLTIAANALRVGEAIHDRLG